MTTAKATDISIPTIRLKTPEGIELLGMEPLRLAEGKTLAVTGPSGAGKSLYLKSLFGWVTSGSPAPLSPQQGAFLMIQDPLQGLTPSLSIGGHFREVIDGRDWREKAQKACTRLGLVDAGLLKRKPATFSGGEKQRLMLALIMAKKPRVLVCDEPASSLDRENERKLWDLVFELKEEATTLIFVTHRLDLIKAYADQVLLIKTGRVSFYGSNTQFFEQPKHPLHHKLLSIYERIADKTEPADQPTEKALIEVRGLSLAFADKRVYGNFSWHAFQGSWNWIIGPSGSGKTSLARFLCGLLPVAKGSVALDGEVLDSDLMKRTLEQRRAIQYLFQHGSLSLNPARKVSRELQKAYADQGEMLAQHLDTLGLAEHDLKRRPHTFSMGELKRLNLIRALATSPRILICDEIFSALDLVARYEMLEYLEKYRRKRGLTLIAITQDQRLPRLKPGSILDLSKNLVGSPIATNEGTQRNYPAEK